MLTRVSDLVTSHARVTCKAVLSELGIQDENGKLHNSIQLCIHVDLNNSS